jgi:hypothetical protein
METQHDQEGPLEGKSDLNEAVSQFVFFEFSLGIDIDPVRMAGWVGWGCFHRPLYPSKR